jgi:hypothetical protein
MEKLFFNYLILINNKIHKSEFSYYLNLIIISEFFTCSFR